MQHDHRCYLFVCCAWPKKPKPETQTTNSCCFVFMVWRPFPILSALIPSQPLSTSSKSKIFDICRFASGCTDVRLFCVTVSGRTDYRLGGWKLMERFDGEKCKRKPTILCRFLGGLKHGREFRLNINSIQTRTTLVVCTVYPTGCLGTSLGQTWGALCMYSGPPPPILSKYGYFRCLPIMRIRGVICQF